MIVYRIEKNGLGPYRLSSGNTTKLYNKLHKHHWCDRHPTPINDGIKDFRPNDHIFGFSSLEQLKKWFLGSRAELRRNGYLMVSYDVSPQEVLHGNLQVVFPKNSYKLKTTRIP
jgi:hypothetical protein